MARVFSAVDIEDPDILRRIKEVRETMNLGFKPVRREKMHITFQFFEDLNEEELGKVRQAVENINVEPFETEVKDVNVFPSQDYIRVIWAGVEENKFTRLYKQVCSHTVNSDNSHEFKPHITFLRVNRMSKEEKRKVQRMLREYQSHSFGSFKVNNVKLFQSKTGSNGSSYRELYRKEL